MELDDLKFAWQMLDRRLEREQALNFQRFKQDRFDRIRSGLRAMRFGQIVRIVFGVSLMVFAAPVWVAHGQEPVLLFCGLIVHGYGVALCVSGSCVLWRVGAIGYAAPVLAIQQQLAQLRSFYLRSSFWLGNAWWVLWAPLLMLCIYWNNYDPRTPDTIVDELYRQLWPQLAVCTAFGIAGLLAFVWLYRFLRRRTPDAVRRIEDQSSRGIANANRVLDEIARFADE